MPAAESVVSVRRVAESALDDQLVGESAAMLGDLVRNGAPLGWVSPPDAARIRLALAPIARAADDDAELLIARHDGALAGLGYWRRYERPTFAVHADLELLAVGDGWQGAGVGRRLCEELVATARRARVEKLTLDFRADNVRAQSLYESMGFRRYGVLPDFVAVGERRYDRLMYVLDLR